METRDKIISSAAKMRYPFTDGKNSLAHFAIGVGAAYFSVYELYIASAVLCYQFIYKYDANSLVDVLESIIGYLAARSFGPNFDF